MACLAAFGRAIASAVQPADESPTSTAMEYSVRAACIFNFIKFTTWPEGSAQGRAATVRVGIVGDDPFGPTADHALAGKIVRGRRLTVERFRTFTDAAAARDRCHVLYVPAAMDTATADGLRGIEGAHVLSIGESAGFCQAGGIIRLHVDRGRVRFDVNLDAAEREGLKISSSVLELATIVRKTPSRPP
jgi:hypothetical protein